MTEEEKGGGGGGLGQHFSPSRGRVRDDVTCPERCPITRITTGTTNARPQSPGTRCKALTLSQLMQLLPCTVLKIKS